MADSDSLNKGTSSKATGLRDSQAVLAVKEAVSHNREAVARKATDHRVTDPRVTGLKGSQALAETGTGQQATARTVLARTGPSNPGETSPLPLIKKTKSADKSRTR